MSMEKTLFIASFPDLGSLDFSKTSFKIGNIDNSDYFFMSSDSNYVHSFINSFDIRCSYFREAIIRILLS